MLLNQKKCLDRSSKTVKLTEYEVALSQLSYLGSDESIENDVKYMRMVKEIMNTNNLSSL